MPLSLASPAWLAALVLVALIVRLGRRHGPADRAHRRATIVRAVGVAALVVALAGPRWDTAGSGVDLVVVVDASDSASASRVEAEGWLAEATAARQPGDRVAVAAVGRDAQVEHGLRGDPPGGPLTVRVDGGDTDLARGLRLAQGLAGSAQRRRVVLLTDGHATRGDTREAIRELTEAGIPVDVVRLGEGTGVADVLVEGVQAPSRVRAGEAYDVTVTLVNTGTSPAGGELVVTADGEEVSRSGVELPPGRTEVQVPQEASRDLDAGRAVRYEARLESAASLEPRNDRGVAAVQLEGPPSVLLIEDSRQPDLSGEMGHGKADELARLLEAGGIPVQRHDVGGNGFPALDALLGHDAAVMVDVHADRIGEAGAVALDAYVRDAGRGLTVVGGTRSYGMGSYEGTRLEELLPVFARIQDPQRRPSVAQALVVDVSGSMTACHCRPDGFGGGPQAVEGGPDKTDISKEAVARAIANLSAQDTVGVLAFHSQAEWVLPLQSVPEQAIVDEALGRLHPDGETGIGTALREAIDGLQDAEARLRHIVLFTDGFTEEAGLETIAAEAAAAGITVSVVGTGEGTGDVLERMAEAGQGRFYPGRDLGSIPSVLASEVQMVARPMIEEGRFTPIVTAVDPITQRLESSPPLLGYVATTAKPTARTLLRIGEERDPLLATWQAGLGTVAAWTSDVAPRWSAPWLGWEGTQDLWGALVRSTLPGDEGGGIDVGASVTGDGLHVSVNSDETLPGDVSVTAVVVDPDGRRREVPLARTDLDAFAADVPAGGDGVSAVTVRVERGDTEVARRTVTAVRSYPAEYAVHAAGADAAAALVSASGRLDPDPAAAFDREGTTPGHTPRDLTGPLLLLALLTLPVDVGLRRLRLERGDLRRLLGSAGAARRPGAVGGGRRGHDAAGAEAGAPAGHDAGADVRAGAHLPGVEHASATPASSEADGPPPPPPTAASSTSSEAPGEPRRDPRTDPPVSEPPPAGGASRLLEARRRARGGEDPPPAPPA